MALVGRLAVAAAVLAAATAVSAEQTPTFIESPSEAEDLESPAKLVPLPKMPRRIRNRKSPRPKIRSYGTREVGERLSLILVVEDLVDTRRGRRDGVCGQEPVPGFSLEAIFDSRRTGLFAARIRKLDTGRDFLVFAGANSAGDLWDAGRFTRRRTSDQHSLDLLDRVMEALGAVDESGALVGRVHFLGHSLGGSLSIFAAVRYGIPHEFTVFNALGVHRDVLGLDRADLQGTAVSSSTDVVRLWNRLTRLQVPGELLRIPRAGLHKPFRMCRYLTHCREPVWQSR